MLRYVVQAFKALERPNRTLAKGAVRMLQQADDATWRLAVPVEVAQLVIVNADAFATRRQYEIEVGIRATPRAALSENDIVDEAHSSLQ